MVLVEAEPDSEAGSEEVVQAHLVQEGPEEAAGVQEVSELEEQTHQGTDVAEVAEVLVEETLEQMDQVGVLS